MLFVQFGTLLFLCSILVVKCLGLGSHSLLHDQKTENRENAASGLPGLPGLRRRVLLQSSVTEGTKVHLQGGIKRNSNSTDRYMFMHVAKTGGSTFNILLPEILELESDTCNQLYNIPWTQGMSAIPSKMNALARNNWGERCNFFTYEWRRHTMESYLSSINYVPSSYKLLTSFREPISHFFSAMGQIIGDDTITPNYQNSTWEEIIRSQTEGHAYYYSLKNFQMSFLLHTQDLDNGARLISTLKPRQEEVRKALSSVYWFALTSEVTLSYALLQCQEFGTVNRELLEHILHKPHKNVRAQDKMHNMSEKLMKDVYHLIADDVRFYELVVSEFWRRIDSHKDCLSQVLDY